MFAQSWVADAAMVVFVGGLVVVVLLTMRPGARIELWSRRRRPRSAAPAVVPPVTYRRAITGRRYAIPDPGLSPAPRLRPESVDRHDADVRAAHDLLDRLVDRNPALIARLLEDMIARDERTSPPDTTQSTRNRRP